MKESSRRFKTNWDWALGATLFLGLIILNGFLVSPYIGWYDSGEMIGTTLCLGISHPSGQVLYHLLGKIILLLTWGSPAWRLGFLSVILSALSSVLFWNLGLKLADKVLGSAGKPLPGLWKVCLLLLTLIWSLSLPWWTYSLTPLVYALHLLLALLVVWAVSLERPGKWWLVFFLVGTATVFRPTQFFALPFVGLAFLWDRWKVRDLSLRNLLTAVVFFGLGRSTLLYLPLRSALHPAIVYADLTHPVALVRHVFAARFSHYVGTVTLSSILSVLGHMASRFWTDLTPLGMGLILAGLITAFSLRKKCPVFLWVALGWGCLEAMFVFTIPFPTFEPHQVLLGWVFSGWLAMIPLVWVMKRWKGSPAGTWMVGGLLLLWTIVQLSQVGHFADRRDQRGAQDYAKDLLQIMEPGSLYYPAEENEYFPVVGYQRSFGDDKNIDLIEPGTDPSVIGPKIISALAQGRTLYVTRKWDLPPGWSYADVGPLFKVIRLSNGAQGRRVSPKAPGLASWGKFRLLGLDIQPGRVKAGDAVTMTYHWVRSGPSPQDDSDMVVALLVDGQGNYLTRDGVFWVHDIREVPMESLYRVPVGRETVEKRILFIPSDYPPGSYQWMVGLQRKVPTRNEGKETFNREFYDRASSQDLEKFRGRGENEALVQFTNESLGNGLWPLTQGSTMGVDGRFSAVSTLEIQKPEP
jgi:hypothetical protein